MTPLLQPFKIEFTSDSHYQQHAVIGFLVAETEMVRNIHKQLSNIYGNAVVNRRTAVTGQKE
jgi:hypothetical protein